MKSFRFSGYSAISLSCFFASTAWASSFGLWTSADLNNNYAKATMPTSFGYSQGDTTVTINPISGSGTDYPGFGTYSAQNGYIGDLTIDPGTAIWAFTPTSYFIEAGAFFDGPSGNLLIQGDYNELKDTVTFRLDQPTVYSVGATGPLHIDAQYPPVLIGPGGQTITINGAMSGTLAAGDWALSMDIVGLTQSDWSAGVYDGGHADEFLLTLPEPIGVVGMFLPALALRRKRYARP